VYLCVPVPTRMQPGIHVYAYSFRAKRQSVSLAERENRAADCKRIFIRWILCLANGSVYLFLPLSFRADPARYFMVCISAISVLCGYAIRLGIGIRYGTTALLSSFELHRRIWYPQYVRHIPDTFLTNVLPQPICFLPRATAELITKLAVNYSECVRGFNDISAMNGKSLPRCFCVTLTRFLLIRGIWNFGRKFWLANERLVKIDLFNHGQIISKCRRGGDWERQARRARRFKMLPVWRRIRVSTAG
jgi:hypothetical protein